MKRSPETWSGALSEYERGQRAAGRSTGTIRLHRHYLGLLRARHRFPWRVDPGDLLDLVATPGWAPETRKSCRAVLRGFYRWGLDEGLIDHNPARRLPPVRVPPALPRPTPELIVDELVASGNQRIALMGMLAAFLGMRVGEIAQVHRRDVLPHHSPDAPIVLLIHGKGGKQRLTPVTDPELVELLGHVDGWAFPNRTGLHLSPGHVSRVMSRALPGGWTAHTLRHRAACVVIEETGDIYAVKELLGHERLETTQVYTRLPTGALVRAVQASSRRQAA